MEQDPSSKATAVTRPRLYNIVHTYIQKQLPRDVHPALKALRDREEALASSLQLRSTQEPTLPLLAEQERGSRANEVVREQSNDYDGDDDLSLEELYKDAASEERLFKAAMDAYEETTKGSKYRTNILSKAPHTWEEVLAEVSMASGRYNDVSGFWGKIRKGLRSFGVNNQALDAWTGLLPTQSQYLSILCGGLKLIISAAARLQDLRSEICEALAEIPTLLACTHRALGAFRRSKELHRCSATLYSATIAALRHIVEWYNEKAIKKFSKSLFKQSSYEKQLSDLIGVIRTHSQRFDRCAILCSHETIAHTDETVNSHRKDTRNNYLEIVERLDRLNLASSQRDNLLGNIVVTETGNIQQMMGALASRSDQMSESKIKNLIETTMMKTLVNFLSSGDRMDFRAQDVRGPSLPIRRVASEAQLRRERRTFRQQLLGSLEYEDSVLEQDVEAKLRTIWTLPKQDQDRVMAIMRSHKLQKWITNTHSSALLINANHQGSTRQQPTSFICAKLVDSIVSPSDAQPESQMILPLAFFCGEHLAKTDPDSGPDGLMRSLLAQLLVAYPHFDLRTIPQIQHLDFADVNDLCDVFDLLIAQLPQYTVVFCVVDAISFFEDNESVCAEANVVVQALVDVVERTKDGGCRFKLLLMSPWNSRVLYRNMPDQERDVVWLPGKVPAQGGFTSLKWRASVEPGLQS